MAKKSSHTGIKVLALGTAVAAAAGAYFLYGTEGGKKTQKKVKGWALKAKGEVLEKLEKSKDVTESTYHNIVDDVTKKYAKVKTIGASEIDELTRDFKKHWKNIQSQLNSSTKKQKKK